MYIHVLLTENGDGGEAKPLVTLRAKPAPPRKPTVDNKPDWIKQAAEKRKRASLLIEQGMWIFQKGSIITNQARVRVFLQLGGQHLWIFRLLLLAPLCLLQIKLCWFWKDLPSSHQSFSEFWYLH